MCIYPAIGNYEDLGFGQAFDVVGPNAAAGKFIGPFIAVSDVPDPDASLTRLKVILGGEQPVPIPAKSPMTIEMSSRGGTERGRRSPRCAVNHKGKCAGTAGKGHGLWPFWMRRSSVTPARQRNLEQQIKLRTNPA